jgi:lysophospholipase L1-like esterase
MENAMMSIRQLRHSGWMRVATLLVCGTLAGCGGGGGGGLSNSDPGDNDLNVVVAFGDSITQGNECPCVSYPSRLAGLIGKTVVNTGVAGSKAENNVERTQSVIDSYQPAFMLILYGVNDIIHGSDPAGITGAVAQMVSICKQNKVVPVLATYPVPNGEHDLFAPGTLGLNANIRALAAAEGLRCVDLEAEFTGENGPDVSLFMEDGLHPNDAGTQIMAMAFADQF